MSGSTFGQTEKSTLGMGFIAMGDGPAAIDNWTPANQLATARANVATLEAELRSVQERYSSAKARLDQLEAEAA